MRLWGTVPTATEPYLSLSAPAMASPVVSGTIALMLQANPALGPNDVKAILQFTAENRGSYGGLTEGAGFLNASAPWSLPVAGLWGNARRVDAARGPDCVERPCDLGQSQGGRPGARRGGRSLAQRLCSGAPLPVTECLAGWLRQRRHPERG